MNFRRQFIISFVLFIFAMLSATLATNVSKSTVLLKVNGPIGPATSDYVKRGFAKADNLNAGVIILQIDTPGGLDTSMREIIQDILSSPIPVVSYVAPDGARAASAGTYILYASHIAAMAPATNLGAATPIQIGGLPMGEEKDGAQEKNARKSHPTLSDKAVNDAVAYIRSLAQLHGRNADWAETAVLEASSLSAKEALKKNVINLIADNPKDLLEKLDGKEVTVMGHPIKLQTKTSKIVEISPDWRTKLLGFITNPNVAYILLMIGFYGLIFEFTHPGTIVSGVAGVICLFLALFALHLLPINYVGLALIIIGIAFMVTEAFLPAFGAFGVGGIISFIIGSIMLLETDIPGYGISWLLIFSVAALTGAFFLTILTLAVRARNRPIVSGRKDMIGKEGHVLEWKDREGVVKIYGEIWNAEASIPLKKGQRVYVKQVKDLKVKVEPIQK